MRKTPRPAAKRFTPEEKTSWGKVAGWYDKHLDEDNTYHQEVVFPGAARLLELAPTMRVIDVGCGEGSFARAVTKTGASYMGVDVAAALLDRARAQKLKRTQFVSANAKELPRFFDKGAFDAASCLLALQNINLLPPVMAGFAHVLRPGGTLVLVINHPAFRIPRQSGWGWDEKRSLQYRRVDSYLSENEIPILMQPSKGSRSQKTFSYHRPLQSYVQALADAGFVITGLEEWTSHRVSTSGPRAKSENRSRQEIPLFLAIQARAGTGVDKRR